LQINDNIFLITFSMISLLISYKQKLKKLIKKKIHNRYLNNFSELFQDLYHENFTLKKIVYRYIRTHNIGTLIFFFLI